MSTVDVFRSPHAAQVYLVQIVGIPIHIKSAEVDVKMNHSRPAVVMLRGHTHGVAEIRGHASFALGKIADVGPIDFVQDLVCKILPFLVRPTFDLSGLWGNNQ
jgi:hypothetical protein